MVCGPFSCTEWSSWWLLLIRNGFWRRLETNNAKGKKLRQINRAGEIGTTAEIGHMGQYEYPEVGDDMGRPFTRTAVSSTGFGRKVGSLGNSCCMSQPSRSVVFAQILAMLLLFGGASAHAATTDVGRIAPRFGLAKLKGGGVRRAHLRGKTTVLVVGRSTKSALPCKKWVDAVAGEGVDVFQVIVTQKPWYLPSFLVRKKISSLVPRQYHNQILIDWGDGFARAFDIPKDDVPTVLVFDANAVLRFKYRGTRSNATWQRAKDALHDAEFVARKKMHGAPTIGTL